MSPRVGQRDRPGSGRRLESGFELLELANGCRLSLADGVDQNRERVAHALEPPPVEDRVVDKRREPRTQGQQMACEVPTVHGRNIARSERQSRLGVVPVVEVPAMPLQRFHSAQCIRRARDELSGREITEVMRRQVGKQRQSHVGRRSPVRDIERRMFLHIVGWQPMVVRADVGLEIRPGLPGQLAQEKGLVECQLGTPPRERTTHPPSNRGRCSPQQ